MWDTFGLSQGVKTRLFSLQYALSTIKCSVSFDKWTQLLNAAELLQPIFNTHYQKCFLFFLFSKESTMQ